MTHCERVLELLEDNRPHSHLEGYGLNVILHSRVHDLRKRGHWIHGWRDGDIYWYQLITPLGEAEALLGGSMASASPNVGAQPPPPGPDVQLVLT